MSQSKVTRRSLLRGAVALGGSGLILGTAAGEVLAVSSTLASNNTRVPYANPFRRPPVLMPGGG